MKKSTIEILNKKAKKIKENLINQNYYDEVEIIMVPAVISRRNGKICGVETDIKHIIQLENSDLENNEGGY